MTGAAIAARGDRAHASTPHSYPSERIDFKAWLGVAAGAIGSFMATLDISIVNASLPTIQGEIGVSAAEGTWVATSYLVAEIVVIPLTGWLERVFGLRRFLLLAATLFTGFSIVCGLASDLSTMIAGRIGQGFTGGAMIPTALTIIATRLPPSQQPIGTAIFGATVILGPVIGPLVGGWLTENYSWHYAFFINVPIGAVLVALLVVGLPDSKLQFNELRSADWWGIVGMSVGLGALTVVLEDGQREGWFESALIWQLSLASFVGFAMMAFGQFASRKPVIKLGLLRKREFAAVFVLSLATGSVLYGTSYVIPQFLAAVADYNAFQAGQVVFLAGIPSLLMMPLVPLLIRIVDLRVAVALGFGAMALGCFLDTALTAESAGSAFTESQLLRGFGQVMALMFLNQAAISAVSIDDASDASGLFNVARNLGGSIALALLATAQETRLSYHYGVIHSSISANSASVQSLLHQLEAHLGGGPEARAAVYRMIDSQVLIDGLVMAFNDQFLLLAIVGALAIPLVLLLRQLPRGRTSMMVH